MIQWCIVQSTEYCKHRKKYERDKLLCKKLEEALECLSNAEKPERLVMKNMDGTKERTDTD